MATWCEASEAKPAGKAVGGGAQRRVCRGETQVCKAGVEGAGPRVPSASRASTNLTRRGICPGDPWAAVTPPERRVEVPSPVREFTRE